MTPSKFARATVSLWRLMQRMDVLHTKACERAAERPVTRWQHRQMNEMARKYIKLSKRALRLTQKLIDSGRPFPTLPPKVTA